MTARPSLPFRRGASLVVTLVFILLLSALVILFLLQASSYRTLANSGVNDFKSTTLARSSLNLVVAGLVQEVVDGSTAVTVGTSTNGTVYLPATNAYAVPLRSGNPAATSGGDPIPNLVRRSVRADAIPAPGVKSLASAVNSTTDPAPDGRYVSGARWNAHYLIPRASRYGDPAPGNLAASAPSAKAGTDPASAFVAPDWVYVTEKGPEVISSPDASTIGRYAYAIYDEGGLLDMNVAGYPSSTPVEQTPHPASGLAALPDWVKNLPDWGSGNRGNLAFANLTALGLTSKQIDLLVGWRNGATARPSGSFDGGYTFAADAALRFHDAVLGGTNGFTSVGQTVWASSAGTRTDQAFPSRQSLIKFFLSANLPPSVLQYLGTFSRDVEQPTFAPAPGRPVIQNATTPAGNVAPFGTGNDAYGADRTGTPEKDINPPFLGVRVAASFTRPDGTTALVGEPLVKKRFPLSRLALLLSTATAAKSDTDPIYRSFGLYRSSASSPWLYDHGKADAGILRLSDVAGREPDFFELLKAAINVGSLGKGVAYAATSSASSPPGATHWAAPGTQGTLQQARDNLTALQILQIGANIIDQAKIDNFPTRIQFAKDTSVPVNEVRGIEDLPYLYRLRNWVSCYDAASTTEGGAVLIMPELWNPHARASSAFVPATATPKNFRVRIVRDVTATAQPLNLSVTYGSGSILTLSSSAPSSNVTVTFNTNTDPAPITFSAGELNGFFGFREPTLLGVVNTPATSALSGTSFNDIYLKQAVTGIKLGTFPWVPPPLPSAPTGTSQPYKLSIAPNGAGVTNATLRVYLEYQDPNNAANWITYEEAPFEYVDGLSSCDFHAIASSAFNTFQKSANNFNLNGAVLTDPRTSRWGFHYGEYFNYKPFISTTDNTVATERPGSGIGEGTHFGARKDAGIWGTVAANAPGNGKDTKGFQSAYWAENSVRKTAQTGADDGFRYIYDPDGVVRRAMGGYATDATNGGDASGSNSTIGLPLATGNDDSRPTLLHRPFRSVAELGYAFRDSPWGNIDFSFPESGDAALLDVFCVNETADPGGLVAGRVSLNTRQAPVLQALLTGTLLNKDAAALPVYTQAMAAELAAKLVARTSPSATTKGYGPLASRADLVGVWTYGTNPATAATALKTAPDPGAYFSGFSADIGTGTQMKGTAAALLPRQREAALRALADSGTVRAWNLLIDLVAQNGRFGKAARNAADFTVEGEKHYWLHIAIDRFTGKILDSQLEVAKE